LTILDKIPFKVSVPALLSALRLPADTEYLSELKELAASADAVARPKSAYEISYIDGKTEDSVEFSGVTFKSAVMRKNLDKVERVFPYIITCGKELDGVSIPAGDFTKAFWLDTIKGMALGAAREFFRAHITKTLALGKVSSMGPGSGPKEMWPIEQQKLLFSIFGDTEKLIGVKLTESFLMVPNKTVSGILFPTETSFQACQLCPREKCPSRGAPYDGLTSNRRVV
jgi:hypothetical protein